MLCNNCKCKIKEKESFEEMTNRILKEARERLRQEVGFGVSLNKKKEK